MSTRVRRVLKLVDELELVPEEVRELRAELAQREECIVDLDGVTDPGERDRLLTIKRRIDAFYRGETKTLSVAEANKFVHEELQRRRQRAATSKQPVERTRARAARRAG